ncbi:MAG: hypothetical protein IPK60_15650 [Sandaracinaceae bacterium]|jgi:hypothetical protein|nr:hypothetical protein [Sandaracinaceae bacterium]
MTRMHSLANVVRTSVVSGALLMGAGASSADAQNYIAFTDYLPPNFLNTAQEYESGYNDLCRDDNDHIDTYRCVQRVLRDMERRYDHIHSTCDHRGLFALAYWETTQEYQTASLEPGFFDDPEFVNHEDVIFARFYTDAYDAWQRGDTSHVPPAWRIAFQSAANRLTTTMGDVLLGMSAHINRDLPIVLATIGLVDPETGVSRKHDHDRVNEFLSRVQLDPTVQAYWDPQFSSGMPGTPMSSATIALIQTWRENAWRWAELIVNAPTPALQDVVLMQIEWNAYQIGLGLKLASSYIAPLQSSRSRDLYCMNHRND